MKSFKQIISISVAALLYSMSADNTVQAATKDYEWSYIANGADWPLIKADGTECHLPNQSPIDLRTRGHSSRFQESKGTEFQPTYKNFEAAAVKNLGKVIQVNLPKDAQPDNYFESGYSKDVLGGEDKFTALQFHFHAKSEHTIDGKRYDLEMHTVHAPDEAKGDPVKIKYSAVGLMFDTENFDTSISAADRATIDDFFDSLNFSSIPAPGKAKGYEMAKNTQVPFGDLMKMVNFANRWVYTGSLTTPPCTVGVYFQVVDRVLPISKRHYDWYIKQQRATDQTAYTVKNGNAHEIRQLSTARNLAVTGNWRVTMPVDNHNVTYMRIDVMGNETGRQAIITTILAIIVAVIVIVTVVLGFVARGWAKQVKAMEEQSAAEGGAYEIAMRSSIVSEKKPIKINKVSDISNPNQEA